MSLGPLPPVVSPTGSPAPPRRRGTLRWRGAILGLLALAATPASLPGPAGRDLPAFPVIDVSDSVRGANDALGEAGEDRLLVGDGVRLAIAGEPGIALSRDRTRVAEGLRAAPDHLMPGGDVWLVSDGWSTEPGVAEAARALAHAGHRVFVSPPPTSPADVGLVSARVVASGANGVTVSAQWSSGVAGRVRVSMRRAGSSGTGGNGGTGGTGSAFVAAEEVVVSPGLDGEVTLVDSRPLVEPTSYDVLLEALDGTPDDDLRDNRLAVLARPTTPLVVVLDDVAWPATPSDAGRRADVVDGARDVAWLGGADAIVLSGRRAGALREEGVARLGALVASGTVLVVLGGPESYGPGGWRGSPLERWLPLRSSAPEGGETAVVVCLDRSGSTGEIPLGGVASLPVLVRALGALADAIPADVRLAVLPFADRPEATPLAPGWVRGSDPVGREALRRAAGALSSAGGTDLDAAIAAASELLTTVRVRRRRVLVVTDGDPDHALSATSFPRARAALARAGVELGAVVHGDAAAADALRLLAVRPEDVAMVNDVGALPAAVLAAFHRAQARDEVVRGRVDVAPYEGRGAEALAALVPGAFHRLEAAPDATLLAAAVASGEDPRPFAAMRTYGAGRVIAVAWGPAFEADAEAARRALLPFVIDAATYADRGFVGSWRGGRLVVEAPIGHGALRVAEVAPHAGERAAASDDLASELVLVEMAPGVYEGELFDAWRGGIHRALLEDGPLQAILPDGTRRSIRLPSRPPPEARGMGVDIAALSAWAHAGGGTRLQPGERPAPQRTRWTWPLAPVVALLALGLFVVTRARGLPALGVTHGAARGVALLVVAALWFGLTTGCATDPRRPRTTDDRADPEVDRPFEAGSPAVQARVADVISRLASDDPSALVETLSQLRGLGEPAVPALIATLRDPSPRVRARAAYALGALTDRRAVEPLAALAAADPDATVRCDAGASLLDLGDPRGFVPLVEALEDPDPRRRVRAIDVLAAATDGARFGYVFDGPPDERADAVTRWRSFLARRAEAETATGVPVAPDGTGHPTR